MPKQPEPLALRAAIPTTESAIKIHGNEGEGAREYLSCSEWFVRKAIIKAHAHRSLLKKPEPLTFEAVIHNSGTPIGFAGGQGEAGYIKLQHYMSAEQIEQVLNLRGAVLKVTIEDES